VSTLTEFLKEQAEDLRAQAPERARIRDEWVAAVGRLIDQLEQWVRQADSEHVLEVKRIEVEIKEWRIGIYKAPTLVIELGAIRVQLLPIARYTLGPWSDGAGTPDRALGRVDLTDGTTKYSLYRYVNDQGEWWTMIDDQNHRPRSLDQKGFEEALLSLMK
jgi:hypothetical protein